MESLKQYTREEFELGNSRLRELAAKATELVDWEWDFADVDKCLCGISDVIKPIGSFEQFCEYYALQETDHARIFRYLEMDKHPGVLSKDCTKQQAIDNLLSFVEERERLMESL